jgi:thiamine transport system permease protein
MADDHQRRLRELSRFLPLGPALAFVLLLVLVPVGVLFADSLAASGGVSALLPALADPVNRRAIYNSLEQGGLSALLAGALGYPVGILLGRYRFPGRDGLLAFLLVPFLLPSLVVILGFQELFGPVGWLSSPFPGLAPLGSGLLGVLAVNAYFNAPMVALLTATSIEGTSKEQEEAVAVLGGTPGRAYREVWGPISAVGAGAGMLLTFLLSALGFAAPLIVCGARCYTLEVRVWSLDQVLASPAAAGVLALITVLLLTVPTLVYITLTERAHRRQTRSPRPARPLPWRDPRSWPLIGYGALFFAGVLLLLAAVLERSVVPASGGLSALGWNELFSSGVTGRLGFSTSTALTNTLAFASGASFLAFLVAVVTAYARQRGLARSGWLEYLLFLPLLVSPVLLAFGLATLWRPVIGGASSTWVLILLSQATIAVPFTVQTLRLGLARLSPAPWEAARTLGRSPFGAHLDTELPRIRAGLIGAALFAFAIGLGEFTATYFLFLPPFATLPVELDRLGALRLVPAQEALGALLMLVSLVVFAAIEWGGRRIDL